MLWCKVYYFVSSSAVGSNHIYFTICIFNICTVKTVGIVKSTIGRNKLAMGKSQFLGNIIAKKGVV